ncbi:hypothetical protein ACFX12_032619 [Malus domestica]
MEEKLIQRLESAVSRLEALSLSVGGGSAMARGFQDALLDPSIVAYEDLIGQYLVRVSVAAEKIEGQMLDITKVLQQAFSTQKDLLIQIKQTQDEEERSIADEFERRKKNKEQ